MSTRKLAVVSLVFSVSLGRVRVHVCRSRPRGPNLGKPISEADVAAWDISILPDGTGLPPGSGTPAQGARIFADKCAVCHGENGKGGTAAALVGGEPLTSRHRNGQDGRELLAVRDDDFRLHSPRDAVAAAAHVDQRRGLRADRIHPGAEQDHRRRRRDERADAAEGAHAEPRRLHPALSGPDLTLARQFCIGQPPRGAAIPTLFNSSAVELTFDKRQDNADSGMPLPGPHDRQRGTE